MRKTFRLFLGIRFLLLILTLAILPSLANSQSNAASSTPDTLNIGYAVYTKGATPGTLNAIWNYANAWSGNGKATQNYNQHCIAKMPATESQRKHKTLNVLIGTLFSGIVLTWLHSLIDFPKVLNNLWMK